MEKLYTLKEDKKVNSSTLRNLQKEAPDVG
jgi:hypothetical protein